MEQISIYARDIWQVLKIKSEFVNWCKNSIQALELKPGVDYARVRRKVKRVKGITTRYEYYFTPSSMLRVLEFSKDNSETIEVKKVIVEKIKKLVK
ncbi:MAG: antA/AntB antirepressor family protein [Patescibacteria group bacterium]